MSRYNPPPMAKYDSDEYFTLKEAADRLAAKGYGGSIENVRSLIKRGKFSEHDFRGHPIVLQKEVEAYTPMDRSQRRNAKKPSPAASQGRGGKKKGKG